MTAELHRAADRYGPRRESRAPRQPRNGQLRAPQGRAGGADPTRGPNPTGGPNNPTGGPGEGRPGQGAGQTRAVPGGHEGRAVPGGESRVGQGGHDRSGQSSEARRRPHDNRPVEFWPTSEIRAALENDDLPVWRQIAAAIKRDPYGRTARQVEEVIETAQPYGVSKAINEVLARAREALEQSERAEVAKHVRLLLDRSGLAAREFASRIGATGEEFAAYLDGSVSPPASLMIRMRRLSDRFAKMREQRSKRSG